MNKEKREAIYRQMDIEQRARQRAQRESEIARSKRTQALDLLVETLGLIDALPETLAAYEATGDHDHGRGPIPVGGACPGGDCNVGKARAIIGRLSAAPDLLAALDGMVAYYVTVNDDFRPEEDALLKLARAAIAKGRP